MVTINIMCVGKVKENFMRDAINEYSKRLSKYCNLNIVEVPDSKVPDKANSRIKEMIKGEEAERILNQLKKDTYLICLDLRGKEYTSPEFSEKIQKLVVNGNSNITFVIGGTLGIGDEILNLAKEGL